VMMLHHNNKRYKLGIGLKKKSVVVSSKTTTTNEDESANTSTEERIVVTLAGRLYQHRRTTWYVWTNSKRYQPKAEDRVVGIVQDRMGSSPDGGDIYKVDIGASHTCTLSSLDFEGATKRNRPQFVSGTLLYARVVSFNGDVCDPVLSCTLGPHDAGIPRKDWMTEEAAYGELKGGTVLTKLPLGLTRLLLTPDSVVLNELSKLPFEVAVGVNGYLWIHSSRPEYTVLIRNAILNSQILSSEQIRSMVRSLISTVKQSINTETTTNNEEEEREQSNNNNSDDNRNYSSMEE